MQLFSNLLSYGLARQEQDELIDGPGLDAGELRENLRDMGRVNRLAGGVALSRWALRQFVHAAQPRQMLTVLDIGCGIGDIPRALACRFRARVLATDISPQIVRMAQSTVYRPPSTVHFAAADGMRLPLADRSVDVAHCSFTLHHFAPDTALRLLREMARVSRRGVIVNDLVRSWPGIAGAWLLGHVLSRNRLTRHDGLASARRAYTAAELRDLAVRAGLGVAAMRVLAGYRAALVLV